MDKLFCTGCNHWFETHLGSPTTAGEQKERDVSPYERQPDFQTNVNVKQLTAKLEDYYSQNNAGKGGDIQTILKLFNNSETEIFKGLHQKYGTLPIDVSFLSTRISDGVCYYRIQIIRDYGALTVEIEKRYNDFYEFNEKISKLLDEWGEAEHSESPDSSPTARMRASIYDQLPPKLFSPSPGRRQIDLEKYLRRVVFNLRLQCEPIVLNFLELYAI